MSESRRTWQSNWAKCCLCQTDKGEGLTSPLRNPARRVEDGYSLLGRNIPLFCEANALPIKLDPRRLDEGNGIEATLRENQAQYHASCKIQFSNSKLHRAEKRSSPAESGDNSSCSKIPRRLSSDSKAIECFICERKGNLEDLREAMTMKLNKRVNECARILNEGKLLAKLSSGDVVAQDLKYHSACLVGLYNKERAHLHAEQQKQAASVEPGKAEAYPIAFSELVTYIIETKSASESSAPPVFRLADMCTLYRQRLEQLGIDNPDVHSTRLKDQLLHDIPDLQAENHGRDVLLAFNKDVGSILANASKYGEAVHLAKAAGLIRREMLKHKAQWNGTSPDGCLEDAVPPSLLQFVCMIEHGADIKSQLQHGASKSDLAMAQLLQYNCFAKYKTGSQVHRHSKDRETPFAVYIGMSIFAKIRKKQLIDMLHENSHSITYDRILEISAQMGEAVLAKYVEDGVVCPPVMRKHVFTTSAESMIIKTNDTDVVVIAVHTLPRLQMQGLESLWIAFGQGSNARWIPVHEVVSAIGPDKASGMLYFHAFTGCDVVSSFHGKGKKSAWLTWDVCGEVLETFAKLSNCHKEVSDDDLQKLERFVVLMYDRSSGSSGVDEARLDLFARKQRSFDAIPPTYAALKEHAKRAAYQAGIIWSQATVSNPEVPSPADWGWIQKENTWQICLDCTSAYCCKLSGTDQVFLQERLQPEMQMLSFRACLYSPVQLYLPTVITTVNSLNWRSLQVNIDLRTFIRSICAISAETTITVLS